MADFIPCFEKVMDMEGGFVVHEIPGDRGGLTYAGIARHKNPSWSGWAKVDADQFDADLFDQVQSFYKKNYWDRIRGDEIIFQEVAYCLFDFGVNAGTKTAVKIAQKIIGALCDGHFGKLSLAALNELIQDKKDAALFVASYSLEKIFKYKDICMKDPRRKKDRISSNEKFLCGWINRVQRAGEFV
ncbi:MAG: hypothetical protein KAI40_03460 [Desulfobacterales bacterium]|nr:hypothetical protein [Desulfobacterales bacterium]